MLSIKAGTHDEMDRESDGSWTTRNCCTLISEDEPHEALFPARKSQSFTISRQAVRAEPFEYRKLAPISIWRSTFLESFLIFAKGEESSCRPNFVSNFRGILGRVSHHVFQP